MAKAKTTTANTKEVTITINRPGVHSKAKTSKLKNSKNYKKLYNGQGK